MRITSLDEQSASDELISKSLSTADRAHRTQRDLDADWFRRKFFYSPYGPSLFALAEEDDAVAGVVAFGRMRLLLNGESLSGGLSYETFVSPDFRGRGLFLELLDHATDAARKAGLRLLFNLPNAASLPGFLKRGWVRGRGFQNWLLPCRPLALLSALSARRGDGTFRPANPEEPRIAPGDLPPFFTRDPSAGRPASRVVEPDYDADFLLWRFSPAWSIDYHAVGEGGLPMIVRTGERWGVKEVQIMEVARDGAASYSRLARTLRDIRRRWSPALITASFSPAHPMTPRLPLHRFLPAPTRSNFCYLPLDAEIAEAMRNTQWSLTAALAHRY